jgi:hypothetical protein
MELNVDDIKTDYMPRFATEIFNVISQIDDEDLINHSIINGSEKIL